MIWKKYISIPPAKPGGTGEGKKISSLFSRRGRRYGFIVTKSAFFADSFGSRPSTTNTLAHIAAQAEN